MNLSKEWSHPQSQRPPAGAAVARVGKNSVFVLTARLLDISMRLVSVALIARYLGPQLFGKLAFVMAFASFLLPLTDFGMERILVREITGEGEHANKFVGSALLLRSILSIALFLCVILITSLFNWDPNLRLGIYLASLAEICASFSIILLGIFRASEKMGYDTVITSIYQAARIGAIIIVIIYDLGLTFIFVSMIVAELFKVLCYVLALSIGRLKKILAAVDRQACIRLCKESYPLGIFALLAMASFKVDIFVLKYFQGSVDISLFEIPHRIITQLQLLPNSLVIALFPVLSRLAKSASKSSLEYIYQRAFKILVMASLPIAITLAIWAEDLISLVFGPEYLQATPSLQILSVTICCLFPVSLVNFALTSVGRQNLTTLSIATCFCVNLLLDLALVPKYGYVGASIATLFAYATFLTMSVHFANKYISPLPLVATFAKPVLSATLMVLLVLASKHAGFNLPWLLGLPLGLISYGVFSLLLKAFSSADLDFVRSTISR